MWWKIDVMHYYGILKQVSKLILSFFIDVIIAVLKQYSTKRCVIAAYATFYTNPESVTFFRITVCVHMLDITSFIIYKAWFVYISMVMKLTNNTPAITLYTVSLNEIWPWLRFIIQALSWPYKLRWTSNLVKENAIIIQHRCMVAVQLCVLQYLS